jgi:hypothetical protein
MVLVSFQVSQPLSRTGFTLVLKILILVLFKYAVDLQTVLSILNATRAFLILSTTSLSVPPLSLLIMLPR